VKGSATIITFDEYEKARQQVEQAMSEIKS
jgi:hypothetical protein